jgi:transposase InsO family protein
MPFQECSLVSQREEFCRLALAEGSNVRELCRRFGIAPATGYSWLGRFRAEGSAGLADRSSRPHGSPTRTEATLEAAVLSVRAAHPVWGGRKIRRVLQRQGLDAPAASTITAILRRSGQLDGPRAGERRSPNRFEYAAPNELWQMDFKGHVAMASGRCHPLTVIDDHARYALEIGACGNETTGTVSGRLHLVFQRFGLPLRILADNGPPWGTAGARERHTQLTIWLLDLGVEVIHGRPYHPQTQGKDERFHRTLKAELLDGRLFADLTQAQRAFDIWRDVYNAERPHEALGLEVPASRYRMSQRAMPQRIDPPAYDVGEVVRKADMDGRITFRGAVVSISRAIAGRQLALRPTEQDGIWNVCYRSHVMARIDVRQPNQTVHNVPEHPFRTSPV